MWHPLNFVIKCNSLNPTVARKLAKEQPDKYNMVNDKISTLNIDAFIKDVVDASKPVSESFEVGDLKMVLEPKIHIDEFCTKIGKDDEICVISFLINDKAAAIDLVDFIEKGYDFCLDADISASEIRPGSYLVFVELLRRARIIPQIFKIISDLSAAGELNKREWKFRYVTDENYYPLTKKDLKAHVPLTPRAYKERVVEPIDEMKKLSGIPVYESFAQNLELQVLQHAAGINRPTRNK